MVVVKVSKFEVELFGLTQWKDAIIAVILSLKPLKTDAAPNSWSRSKFRLLVELLVTGVSYSTR